MKTIAGASLRAAANSSRTRIAPMPTYNSTNSEAAMEKKGTPASPARHSSRGVHLVSNMGAERMHSVLVGQVVCSVFEYEQRWRRQARPPRLQAPERAPEQETSVW
jgi:hypothetical protein